MIKTTERVVTKTVSYEWFFERGKNKAFEFNKKGGREMKIVITKNCMGDRNCNELCPEVFEYDEDQLKSVSKFDEIPEQYHEVVRQAAAECGAEAIEIIEDDE
jgi:ferredoxin